ncbi:hypothetical protein PSMK_26580 [Phycisphaera mikurensis NBRC 102666]|uniref:Uncharacterized protein n=1 Tax=Phycisphaera mikurensis (strain NBRC 102666 / KCTC 22515 / FYK2301M01) TaxID=1142394 RepID=I0IHS9_PHYMF|nr:hypothetical protein PSMK_26580 [Phycisphaera mikurensis NBRC 102666]
MFRSTHQHAARQGAVVALVRVGAVHRRSADRDPKEPKTGPVRGVLSRCAGAGRCPDLGCTRGSRVRESDKLRSDPAWRHDGTLTGRC